MMTATQYRAAVAAMARLGQPEFTWTQPSKILGGRLRLATIRARQVAEAAPSTINQWLAVALECGLDLNVYPGSFGDWELRMTAAISEAAWTAAAEESVAIAKAAAAKGRTVVAVGAIGPAFGGAR